MKAKKNLALVAAGIVIGAFLAFPTAHAAEELFTAVRSSHQFFLDGKQVQMEAYIINGNNYVKLADVGKMVGFNVYWDGAVYMDSDAPYTGKAPEASCFRNGSSSGIFFILSLVFLSMTMFPLV